MNFIFWLLSIVLCVHFLIQLQRIYVVIRNRQRLFTFYRSRCEAKTASSKFTCHDDDDIDNQKYQAQLHRFVQICSANGRPELGMFQLAPLITHHMARESSALLLGPAAILMQLAHWQVAYGVNFHSYSSTTQGMQLRAIRTLMHGMAITFGTLNDSVKSSKTIRALHMRVSGLTAFGGNNYAANNKQAMLWVLATIIESSVVAYEIFIRQMTNVEKETNYEFSRQTACVWGLSEDDLPPTWSAFLEYYHSMLNSDCLCAPPPTHDIVKVMLPSTWERIHATTLLPPHLCQLLKFPKPSMWTLLFSCLLYSLFSAVYRLLPVRVRQLTWYADWQRRERRDDQLGMIERTMAKVGRRLLGTM